MTRVRRLRRSKKARTVWLYAAFVLSSYRIEAKAAVAGVIRFASP
jgi:hypothetical protein